MRDIMGKQESLGGPKSQKHINSIFLLMIWNSSPESAESPESAVSPDLPEVVSGAAARDLPSTRAGGQDDVSSKQTPSNNGFREYVFMF